MIIITWNVNHRAVEKKIPPLMADALASLNPDVIVLTEFVPGKSRDKFFTDLNSHGYVHTRMSSFTPKENHLLIASRHFLNDGNIKAPPIAPSVPSNALHVYLPTQNINILGLRIPDYSKKPFIKRKCWEWILETTEKVKESPFIFLGDFNTDPNYTKVRCGDRFNILIKQGWQNATPSEGASYWSPIGNGVRIDHAFTSNHLLIKKTQFIKQSGQYVFVGKDPEALSDHAILMVDLEHRTYN